MVTTDTNCMALPTSTVKTNGWDIMYKIHQVPENMDNGLHDKQAQRIQVVII